MTFVLVLCLLQLIDFSSHYVLHFPASLHISSLYRMTNIVDFTLLEAKYFCYPIKMIEICSGIKLNQLETVIFSFVFQILLDRLEFWTKYSHNSGKTLLGTLSNVPWIMRFPSLANNKRNYFPSSVSITLCSL